MPMTPPEKVTPPPLSGNRIPGPKYELPPSPPAPALRSDAPERPKPLMILRIRPGVTFDGSLDKKMAALEQATRHIGEALEKGGGLVLDESVIEPLVLIYGGQVIRFDPHDEEDPEGVTGGYKPEPQPRPTRRIQEDRETW